MKMARQYQPDILIVDIQIPGCTGLELCQELRQEGYSGLIIISTSYSLFRYAYLAIKLNVLELSAETDRGDTDTFPCWTDAF